MLRKLYLLPVLRVLLLALIWAMPSASTANEAASADELWTALKTGSAFAMMRHALAPGTGDPPNFDVGDCSTQRNLSDAGRRQAARSGARFRERGIMAADVYTSAWCRCRETADLLKLGNVRRTDLLNSFFLEPSKAAPQTTALKAWLNGYQTDSPLVLVTHQVNITALTSVYPRSGEIVVVQRLSGGRFRVMGAL